MTAELSSPLKFSTKDFPRPIYTPSPSSKPTNSNHIVLRYTRSLVGITGVVTTSSMNDNDPFPEAMAPTGLGGAADAYLNAHGYDANSRLYIMFTWRENGGLAG